MTKARLEPFQNAEFIDRPTVYINPTFVMAVVAGDAVRKNDRPDPELTTIVLANGLTYLVHGKLNQVCAQLLTWED